MKAYNDYTADNLHFDNDFAVVEYTQIIKHVHIIKFFHSLVIQVFWSDVTIQISVNPTFSIFRLNYLFLPQIHLVVCIVVVLHAHIHRQFDSLDLNKFPSIDKSFLSY